MLPAAMERAPECFLILMADQLAAQWLPFYGHPLVQAPHLSGLARDATVYESAYSAYPLCAPSRAAMLTGRCASSIGVYDNAAELRATVPTVAHTLRAAGYQTAVAGKMHFVGPDQLHGFEQRLTTDIYPADVDWTPDWERPLDQPLPWYHTMESVLNPGVCAASMQTDYDEEVAFEAVRQLHDLGRAGSGRGSAPPRRRRTFAAAGRCGGRPARARSPAPSGRRSARARSAASGATGSPTGRAGS